MHHQTQPQLGRSQVCNMQLPCSRLSESSAPRGPSASPAFISVYPPPAGILFPRTGWSHSVSKTHHLHQPAALLTVSMRSLGMSAGDVRGWQGGMSLQGVGRRRESHLSSDRLFKALQFILIGSKFLFWRHLKFEMLLVR